MIQMNSPHITEPEEAHYYNTIDNFCELIMEKYNSPTNEGIESFLLEIKHRLPSYVYDYVFGEGF